MSNRGESPVKELTPRDVFAFKRRERRGLEVVFEVYFPRVHALVQRMVGRRDVAEDLVQEVFLRIARNADSVEVRKSLWPWIVTIACNVCRDHWTRSARRNSRETEASFDAVEVEAAGPGPLDKTLNDERRDDLSRALDDLPAMVRTIVLLHDFEGMNHREVADVVGMSHEAVRKQYSRGLRVLSRSLEGVR